MKKTVFRVLFSAMLIVLSLSACSYDPRTPEEDLPDGYEASSENYEYTILSDLNNLPSLCDVSDDSGLSDRLRAHYAKIEEELGCKIVLQKTADAIESNVFKMSTGSEGRADLIETDALTVSRLLKGGYLTALDDIPNINVSDEKFGLDSQKNMFLKDGKTYGIFPLYLGVSAPTYDYVLYYNEDIVSDYSALSPSLLYERGQWTLENFSKIANDIVSNGASDELFAFVTPTAEFPSLIDAALLSEDMLAAVKDGNGKYSCGYERYETISVIDKIKKMVAEDKVSVSVTGDNADIYSFAEGKTAFLVSTARVGFSLDEEFPPSALGKALRWISFPSDKKTVSAFGKHDTFYAVTTSGKKNLADSSVILDRIFSVMEGDSEESWKESLSERYFFRDGDFDSYISNLENAADDGVLKISDNADGIHEAWASVIRGNKSSAQAYDEIKSMLDGLLSEYN